MTTTLDTRGDYPLSLAAGVLPEFAPDRVAEAAGRAGFPMTGFTIEPGNWTADTAKRVRQRVEAWELVVLDVEVVWIAAGGQLQDHHRVIVEAGAELGARNLLVVSSEPDRGRNAAALHQLCEWAAPAGMRVALEFLMLTEVRSLREALAVVSACDHPAAAVLVDALHLARAGAVPADVAEVPRHLLPYAQFCDGLASCADDQQHYLEDAVDLRSAPGEGELPLGQLLAALPTGCPLSLEVRSRAYRERYAEPETRARAVLEQTRAFLTAHAVA
jgi:sugar phosphate isomerase/epimerase